MGARSGAREAALQLLFGIEASGNTADQAIYDYWREMPGDAEGRDYANEIAVSYTHLTLPTSDLV